MFLQRQRQLAIQGVLHEMQVTVIPELLELHAAHIETNRTTDGAHDNNNSLLLSPWGPCLAETVCSNMQRYVCQLVKAS